MDCNRPPKKSAEKYSYNLRFEWQEWDVIKAAARERICYRKEQALEPFEFDITLTGWDETRGLLVGDSYPDSMADLLKDYGQRTDEEAAAIGQEAARQERQALGQRALSMIDELQATVTANLEARTMATELADLFKTS